MILKNYTFAMVPLRQFQWPQVSKKYIVGEQVLITLVPNWDVLKSIINICSLCFT